MCLIEIIKPNHYAGIGYKIVRKLDDGVYQNAWQFFLKGSGGCVESAQGEHYHEVAIYKLNERYTIDHSDRCPVATATGLAIYYPGIHLYYSLSLGDMGWEWLVPLSDCDWVAIKCYYFDTIARDGRTVVARSIEPFQEIPLP